MPLYINFRCIPEANTSNLKAELSTIQSFLSRYTTPDYFSFKEYINQFPSVSLLEAEYGTGFGILWTCDDRVVRGRGQRNKEREKAEHVWAFSGSWSQFDSIGPLLKEIVTELGQHKLGACVTYLHICH